MLGQDNWLFETDNDDEEWEAFGEQDHINWDTQLRSDDETEEESKDGTQQDCGGKPKVGPKSPHGNEERHKSQVHGEVAKYHYGDVQGFRMLGSVVSIL